MLDVRTCPSGVNSQKARLGELALPGRVFEEDRVDNDVNDNANQEVHSEAVVDAIGLVLHRIRQPWICPEVNQVADENRQQRLPDIPHAPQIYTTCHRMGGDLKLSMCRLSQEPRSNM